MKRLAIVYHRGVEKYDFGPGHPFRGDRFPRYIRLLESRGTLKRPETTMIEPNPAQESDLLSAHSIDYIRKVERLAQNHVPLSPDTPLNPDIHAAARLIVGATVKAGLLVANGEFKIAQGVGGGLHHAGRDYGGGFCVFNDIAVCAKTLERKGLERVLVFDSDAHAGNGTMDIFYEDQKVLYISVHQDPRTIYPGTGFVEQIGKGQGEGFTVNIPLPPGAGDRCMNLALEKVFEPLTAQFKPEIIIRNGGSDPHQFDGLASLGLTFRGLRSIGEAVARTAHHSGCGIVDLCCSGYNPDTVAEGWYALLSGEIGVEFDYSEEATGQEDPRVVDKTEKTIGKLAALLSGYWNIG